MATFKVPVGRAPVSRAQLRRRRGKPRKKKKDLLRGLTRRHWDSFKAKLVAYAPYTVGGALALRAGLDRLYACLYREGCLNADAPPPRTDHALYARYGMKDCWSKIPRKYRFKPSDQHPDLYPAHLNPCPDA